MLLAQRLRMGKQSAGCAVGFSFEDGKTMGPSGPEADHQYDPVSDTGYYGFVESADLIDGLALETTTGFTEGTDHNSTVGWLKFYVGPDAVCNTSGTAKVIYVAKNTLKHNVSWDNINSANLITGTRTIDIGGFTYRVRLLTGGMTSPGIGSEWNQLLYRVASSNPAGTSNNWAAFTDTELNQVHATGAGRHSWVIDKPSTAVFRGGSGIAYWITYGAASFNSNIGWRPVLEFVSED